MDAQRKHAQAMFEQLRNASEAQQRALSVQIATLEENRKRQQDQFQEEGIRSRRALDAALKTQVVNRQSNWRGGGFFGTLGSALDGRFIII